MHFGTFVGSALEAGEPLVELALLRREERRAAKAGSSQGEKAGSEPGPGGAGDGKNEVLGPEVQVVHPDPDSEAGEGGAAGGWLWGKRPGVLRKLTAMSSRNASRDDLPSSSKDGKEVWEDEGIEEADRWQDEGGFGWVDIGASAVVPLQLQ